MKQLLTIEQVNEGLKQYPKLNAVCTGYNMGAWHIKCERWECLVTDKKVFVLFNDGSGSANQNCKYQREFNGQYFSLFTKKEDVELMQTICGMKGEKRPISTDLQRLSKLGARDYAAFYKLIKEVEVIDSRLEYEQIYEGYGKYRDGNLLLTVIHTKGSFRFPIECITGIQEQDEQIQNIFLNLLGRPVTSKQLAA